MSKPTVLLDSILQGSLTKPLLTQDATPPKKPNPSIHLLVAKVRTQPATALCGHPFNVDDGFTVRYAITTCRTCIQVVEGLAQTGTYTAWGLDPCPNCGGDAALYLDSLLVDCLSCGVPRNESNGPVFSFPDVSDL